LKKSFILILIFQIGNVSFSQKGPLDSAVDTACTCLYDASLQYEDKLLFDEAYERCLGRYLEEARMAGAAAETRDQLSNLIHVTLKGGCEEFDYIDSVRTSFLYKKETDFVVDISECELLKNGKFVGVGDDSGTYILMQDSIQMVHFSDGTYTKSKVVWSPICTYQLIRIESTNAYESTVYQEGDIREFAIVGIEDRSVFQYQTIINGKVYMGRLAKVPE
jgi:hypothetical protein